MQVLYNLVQFLEESSRSASGFLFTCFTQPTSVKKRKIVLAGNRTWYISNLVVVSDSTILGRGGFLCLYILCQAIKQACAGDGFSGRAQVPWLQMEGDYSDSTCPVCRTQFATYAGLRVHVTRSLNCNRKRKVVEDDCDGEGTEVDPFLPPPLPLNDIDNPDFTSVDYATFEGLRLRLLRRIVEQRGDSFNPIGKPFSSFTAVIELAALHPDGYFGNRTAFDGNMSEWLYGMHFVENPRASVDAVDKLRNLLKQPDFNMDDVVMSHKTRMQKLYATIDAKDKFQKVALYRDLSLADRGIQVYFYVRSLYAAICRLVDRFPGTEFDLQLNRVLNEEGVRVYNREIASTDRLKNTKAWVSYTYGPDVVCMPLYLGWDGVRFVVALWLYRPCTVLVQVIVQILYKLLYKYCTSYCTNIVQIIVQILYTYLYSSCASVVQFVCRN